MRYNAGANEDFLSYNGRFKSIREWTNSSGTTKVEQGQWTKRKIARAAASIYDPHGLISPFTVRSKIILQEIWKIPELTWDDKIPDDISEAWEQWLEQVFVIQDLQIPRWTHFEPKTTTQVHTFCDASEQGMCVAVYLRVKKRQKVYTTLLAAKARVSPLRAESISRLELVACTMGVRLSHAVREVYPVKPEDTFYWTDSMVCLHWIFTPSKAFKAYVAHRVGEIQNFTEPRQWKHVPSKQNPADVGTREITATELKTSQLWWEGPDFLKLPHTEWPKRTVIPIPEDSELKPQVLNLMDRIAKPRPRKTVRFEENVQDSTQTSRQLKKKSSKLRFRRKLLDYRPRTSSASLQPEKHQDSVLQTEEIIRNPWPIDPERYSTGMLWNGYRKLVRMTAWVMRFVRNLKIRCKKLGDHPVLDPHLNLKEIQEAHNQQIVWEQNKFFRKEIQILKDHGNASPVGLPRDSRIRKFTPFLDRKGILRCRSRLEKTRIYGYDQVYPVILDRGSGFTRLIAEDAHFELAHPVGLNAAKARIQRTYAILGLGTLLSTIKFKCSICQRHFNRPAHQLQAPLPIRRLGEIKLRAFTDVGMDYAGPFKVVMGRGQRRKKIYILVLTCMATRAVHLEPTGGMDTTDVLNAISRFSDVRGIPCSITSDNQTSFTKANQDLIDWIKTIDFEYLQKNTQEYRGGKGIEWYFNPPQAPHFGGVFETIVKATKRALQATIGNADLSEEDFRTSVSKVAWMLNQRPIQKVGDTSDWETLTPNHFVQISDEATFPPDLPEGKTSLQVRLQRQIEVQQHFWKRFQREIIPMLAPRSKWFQRVENLQEGQLVIEIDDSTPRGKWKLARIRKIFPSTDSFVRKVEIIDGQNRSFLRPIHRLIPIQL